MRKITDEYRSLLLLFIERKLDYDTFSRQFFTKFQSEDRRMSKRQFLILDKLFADIEVCTDDIVLLKSRPLSYISEEELRKLIIVAIGQLS